MISLLTRNARELLTWVALFLGELRDGLTMVRLLIKIEGISHFHS
jgi:hypothetical protein